jgi:hypothetical protein
MTKRRLLPFLILTLLLAALGAAPSALAAEPPTTKITSPADGTYTLWNYETNSGSLSVSGSTTGTLSAVDVRCYHSTQNQYVTLQANVPLDGSGNFSVTNASLNPLSSYNCLLIAVPTATTPSIPDPAFTGPRIFNNETGNNIVSGHVADFYDFAAQTAGSWGYDSTNSCSISYSQLNEQVTNRASTFVFDCNQYFADYKPSSSSPVISGLRVNGLNAYGATAFWSTGAGAGGGYPPLAHTFSVDPATHDATITEASGFSTCPANAVAPDGTNCATATDTGLTLSKVMHQDHAGLVARVTDDYKNNTAAPMTLNIAYKQYMWLGLLTKATSFAMAFPNGTNAVDAAPYATVGGPFASPSTIYISEPTKADGDVTSGRGAITMYPGADGAVFESKYQFYLLYNRTIPPGGTLRIDASFAQAYGQAQVAALASESYPLLTPQPSFGPKTKSSLKLDKKKKHIAYVSGQSVLCPAVGQPCAISGKLTTKVKLPAKKRKKGSKKKPKAKYKTYTLGKITTTGAPGSTTALNVKLGTQAIKLFKKYGKLKTTFVVNVSAGPYAAASQTFVTKLKSPKFPKPKKKH